MNIEIFLLLIGMVVFSLIYSLLLLGAKAGHPLIFFNRENFSSLFDNNRSCDQKKNVGKSKKSKKPKKSRGY